MEFESAKCKCSQGVIEGGPLRLISGRGKLMTSVWDSSSNGMLLVVGPSDEREEGLIEDSEDSERLFKEGFLYWLFETTESVNAVIEQLKDVKKGLEEKNVDTNNPNKAGDSEAHFKGECIGGSGHFK